MVKPEATMSQFTPGHTPAKFPSSGALLPLLALLLSACAATPPASIDEPAMPVATTQETAAAAAAPTLQPSASTSASPAVVDANAIFFRRGEAQISNAEAVKLDAHAERLRANPRLVVTLIGHTDHLGSRAYNLAIAEQRTVAVMKQLRELGVPTKQIRRRSYGNETAITACRSEECRARMRRVDLLYPKSGSAG
jgi:outer membrane protein OmpA-like peptidoglycan-associated protein